MTSNITVSVKYTLVYSEDYYDGGSIHTLAGDSRTPHMIFLWINPDFVRAHKKNGIAYDEDGFYNHLPSLDEGIRQNYDLVKQECRKLILKSIL